MNSSLDPRRIAAHHWAAGVLGGNCTIRPLAGDASFRRYFRISHQGEPFVLMDAPPEKENVGPFLNIRRWLETVGVRVPHLVAEDMPHGFLLLEDFGDVTWAVHLRDNPDPSCLLEDAIRQLGLLQSHVPDFDLAIFDEMRMRNECDLYLDWYLPYVAAHKPSVVERRSFHDALAPILGDIAALPRVPVHLDYHSRNLMLPKDGLPLGVIDFQDAVMGPVTYDLASLLYDCYQDYSEAMRRMWSLRYFELLAHKPGSFFTDSAAWHRALRLTALQRHIKAIGIFARLAYRDGKSQFLDEIPLTRKHLHDEMLVLSIKMDKHPLLLKEPAT
ncbi:MAG: phosphotransferase [Zetaproteobacteria bacterium]|nr:MAG: phosphotransferase [Zetaproteobacteria bacterium]